MVSIIIPTIYRPDLAKVCFDSVFNYTAGKFEVIFVHEGENAELRSLAKGYEKKYGKKFKYVQNVKPKGFAGAHNTGISVASGNIYCFLNSDTVAIPGWIEPVLEVFKKDPKIGLVSPLFTEATPNQSIENIDREDVDYIENPLSLKGVCFFIRKSVLEEIGNWDESFGLGGGDDNDMCYRIKQAGHKLVVARKSYIYHYGSASFREEFKDDVDFSKKFAVGQFNKFREKHNVKDKPTIFLSIPCFDGFIHHELALRLIQWSHDDSYGLKVKFYPNLAPLDNARNRAVKDFLEEYCDYFMHIDDDIVPPVNTIRKLLKADKDVIAPLCFTMAQDDKGTWFPRVVAHRYNAEHKYEPYYGKGIEETDVVTGGCHLVKRHIMEKLERPYYFTYHKNGIVIYSEDFVFSQQVQKLGYKLYTDYDLPCKHIRYGDVKAINDLMVRHGR